MSKADWVLIKCVYVSPHVAGPLTVDETSRNEVLAVDIIVSHWSEEQPLERIACEPGVPRAGVLSKCICHFETSP